MTQHDRAQFFVTSSWSCIIFIPFSYLLILHFFPMLLSRMDAMLTPVLHKQHGKR
jgi:hypothetical protein